MQMQEIVVSASKASKLGQSRKKRGCWSAACKALQCFENMKDRFPVERFACPHGLCPSSKKAVQTALAGWLPECSLIVGETP
jgi:hypothetical protein